MGAPASHLIFRIKDLPRPRKAGVRFSKGGIACILVPCRASRKQNSLPDSPLTVSAVLRDDDKFRRGAGMDLGITGRVAIVAAASKGLGRAVAEELAREGAHVAICARTPATLAETAAHLGQSTGREAFHQAHGVTDSARGASVVSAVEEIGRASCRERV